MLFRSNEFRIWSGELTGAEVVANLAAGPDTVIPEPGSMIMLVFGSLLMLRRRRSR